VNIGVILTILAAAIALFIQYASNREKSPSSILSAPEHLAELNASLVDPEPIWTFLRRGNKINAIKLYRKQTGVGLKEAKEAVERMEAELKVSAIGETASKHDVPDLDELQRLVQAKQKLQAIKYYRETTGVGLKEAKEAVDRIATRLKVPIANETTSKQSTLDPDELQRLIRAKQKIQAIKYYRETTGVGLKEAKEAVDWLEAQIHQEN
jgi:ribosomal protein L7/L12